MPAIDSTMLLAMRAAISELLPDSCNILTPTNTPDSEGGVTTAWGTSSAVACRLDAKQGREMLTGGAIQPYTTYILSLPYDTTIAQTSRVLHGGVTYAVKSINLNQSWIAVRRVELERI